MSKKKDPKVKLDLWILKSLKKDKIKRVKALYRGLTALLNEVL